MMLHTAHLSSHTVVMKVAYVFCVGAARGKKYEAAPARKHLLYTEGGTALRQARRPISSTWLFTVHRGSVPGGGN